MELCADSIEGLNAFEFVAGGVLTVLGAAVQKKPVDFEMATAMASGAFLGVG